MSLIAKQISKRAKFFRTASVSFSFPYDQMPKNISDKKDKLAELVQFSMDNQMDPKKFSQHDKEIEQLEKEMAESWPEPNFSNDNARSVLKSLGYRFVELYGKLEVAELLNKIMHLKNSKKEQGKMKQHERDGENFKEPGKVRYLDFPLTSEDIMEKILRLEKLAIKAKEIGVTEIHFG